nr:MAG TPA: holin [Caudoviricetes sp.]
MKINWGVRFRNKTWLLTFIPAVLTLVYRTLNVLGIAPHIAQEQLLELATMLVGILVLLGVVIDPTTKGGSDSELAMTYKKPRDEIGGEHTPGFTAISQEEHDPSDAPADKEV